MVVVMTFTHIHLESGTTAKARHGYWGWEGSETDYCYEEHHNHSRNGDSSRHP
jgi:hypothetical protein